METKLKQLTDFQKNTFLEIGFKDEDLNQLLLAINLSSYEKEDGLKISRENVIRILGELKYLYGISRSAFHYTAVQYDDKNKNTIYFNSSMLFK